MKGYLRAQKEGKKEEANRHINKCGLREWMTLSHHINQQQRRNKYIK